MKTAQSFCLALPSSVSHFRWQKRNRFFRANLMVTAHNAVDVVPLNFEHRRRPPIMKTAFCPEYPSARTGGIKAPTSELGRNLADDQPELGRQFFYQPAN
jgi:hypothetical protein